MFDSKNDELITQFTSSLGAISQPRTKKYRLTLGKISRELGPFERVSRQDLTRHVQKVNSSSYKPLQVVIILLIRKSRNYLDLRSLAILDHHKRIVTS